MPLSLRDLAPFITPYTSMNDKVEANARSLSNITALTNNRESIAQRDREAQAQLESTKATREQTQAYNRDQLAETQRYHSAMIQHNKDSLERDNFADGQKLLDSVLDDLASDDPARHASVGVKAKALERYGFSAAPEQQPAPPPATAVPAAPMQQMPGIAPPVPAPQPAAPPMPQQEPGTSIVHTLPPAQGQPTPGAPAQQQPAPQQPQMPRPAPQAPAVPGPIGGALPQPAPQPPPQRWNFTYRGKPYGTFDVGAAARQRAQQTEGGLRALVDAQRPEDRAYAESVAKAAMAMGKTPKEALDFARATMLEHQKYVADIEQHKAQEATAARKEASAAERQRYIEQRDNTRYQLDKRRLELQLLRDQARDESTKRRLDQQITQQTRTADRMEGEQGWRHIDKIATQKQAPQTASSISLLEQQLKTYWEHPNDPKYWKAAAYAIAKARDDGKISDADVASVPEITGWLNKAKQWAANNFEGETDPGEFQAMGGMLKSLHKQALLHSHEQYLELSQLRDSEGDADSPAYQQMDKYLRGTYNGLPWWKAQRESEGLSVDPEAPKKKEPPDDDFDPQPREDLAPLPETIRGDDEPQEPSAPLGAREAPPAPDMNGILDAAAEEYGVDPALLRAVAQQESGGDPTRRSDAGAEGLLQLMPGTAKDLGVTNSMDPTQNAYGGAKYLAQLLKQFDGDVEKALQAYNGGPNRMKRRMADGKPMPAESRNYSRSIMGSLEGQGAPEKQRQSLRSFIADFTKKNGRVPTREEAEAFAGGG